MVGVFVENLETKYPAFPSFQRRVLIVTYEKYLPTHHIQYWITMLVSNENFKNMAHFYPFLPMRLTKVTVKLVQVLVCFSQYAALLCSINLIFSTFLHAVYKYAIGCRFVCTMKLCGSPPKSLF